MVWIPQMSIAQIESFLPYSITYTVRLDQTDVVALSNTWT